MRATYLSSHLTSLYNPKVFGEEAPRCVRMFSSALCLEHTQGERPSSFGTTGKVTVLCTLFLVFQAEMVRVWLLGKIN
jgi:hypothetical protein